MIGLTAPQKRVLDFIEGYAAEHGRVPNYVQIAAAVGYSGRSGGFQVVQSLIEKGRLVVAHGTAHQAGYALPVVQVAGDAFAFVPAAGRRLTERGMTTAYRGPYPIRGVTCADFGSDGRLHRKGAAFGLSARF